jgi:D-beta-D-heptose 7-phosphate kinase/D-beta-D-heptose 1-phosphate adenosyltransferase
MIVKFSQLSSLRKRLNDKKIVFAGGTFDLMHCGHVESFRNLRKFGDVVVVAVTTDKRVKQRKGIKRPILGQKERCDIVDSIRYVDYSLIAPQFNIDKPVPTVRILAALKPDTFVSADKRWLKHRKEIEKMGVKLIVLPRIKKNSTTRIIRKILKVYAGRKLTRDRK